ncbi:hypothetical protein [Aliicoccus persicus]|uniref:Uncharacterized protein n=2 Tax=Aliicoccus persicus TaxID=930138 RepID=A0A662Z4C0_9STAP|nr:hypothetical protein [Aliicoccus persicus]SEW10912.1 hypothetical protein SAMN05192557_1638 [Aliicoccus persicus]
MKRLFLGMTSIIALLTACDDNEREPIGLGDDETETSEEVESDNSESEDKEPEDDVLEVADPDEEDLLFDITDETILDQFVDITEPFEMQFENNFIQKGMNQENIEQRYGTYDLVLMTNDGITVVYGNIAVKYIHGNPAGEGLLGDPTIDPVTNIVTEVFYFADVPQEEVIEAFGEPVQQVPSAETKSGQEELHYMYTGNEGETYTVRAIMNDGHVDMIVREDEAGNYSTSSDGENVDEATFETYTEVIETFMADYEAYYQNDDESVFEHVRPGSQAQQNLTRVNYENYELHDLSVNFSFDHNDGTVTVNTNVYFDHDGLDNRQNASIIFTLDKSNLEIIDFSAFSVQDY